MKKLISVLLLFFSTNAFSGTVDNLRIIELGAWSVGNSIMYIRFDKPVGPSSCHSSFVKVYLGSESDSENQLNAKNLIRSFALTALTADLNVKVNVLDTCLHNSPTISTLYLKR